MEHKNWNGFKKGVWQDEINVRDFIQQNYKEYLGDGFEWKPIGTAKRVIGEDYLVLEVDRATLGLCGSLDFEFKWSDNMQTASVMDFYYNGDCAPHGRFNYLYKE